MRPPRARTWGRRGITPVIRVRGGGTGRVSVAGLACYRPGDRSRLIYRLHCYRGRKGETKAFTWIEYRDLLLAAHRQLPGGNVVLVWDNLNVHLGAELRAFTGAQAWLRVFRLPAYAPDLNPVEGIWSVLKGGVLANVGRTPRGFAPCAQLGYLAFHWSPAELSQSGHDGPAVSAGMPGFPPVKSWIAGSRTAASLAPEPQRKSTRSARLPAGE